MSLLPPLFFSVLLLLSIIFCILSSWYLGRVEWYTFGSCIGSLIFLGINIWNYVTIIYYVPRSYNTSSPEMEQQRKSSKAVARGILFLYALVHYTIVITVISATTAIWTAFPWGILTFICILLGIHLFGAILLSVLMLREVRKCTY